MNTTLAQAKAFFEAGFLSGYLIVRHPDGGWFVDLGKSGCIVDARTKTRRIFKSLDAAVSALEQIGFQVDALTASAD
jgi:hypothetical protein